MTLTDTTCEETAIATPLHARVAGKALIDALTALAPAVSKRSTLPILSNVKITASPTGLCVEATNLETFIQVDIPAVILQQGSITTNYKELVAMVKPLGKKEVTLEVQETTLRVKTAGMVLPLSTMPAEDFPNVAQMKEVVQSVEIPVATFKECIGHVVNAAQQGYADGVFNGVNIAVGDGMMHFTAADRFRLSTIRQDAPCADRWMQALLISAQALKEIVKKLPKTGFLTLEGDGGCISKISCGPVTIYQRTIEGNYPRFEMIIPKASETTASLDVSSAVLADALTSLAPVAQQSANIVTLTLAVDGTATLSAKADDKEPSAKLEGATITGEITLKLNYVHLKEALVGTEEIRLTFSAPNAPVKMTSADVPGWTGVMMPMFPNR